MKEIYSRNHIYVCPEEQSHIRKYRVLLGGAGIGSIIAECALRLGFETLTIVDGDIVEESNLNRQNYRQCDIGRAKVDALKERLLEINPKADITVVNSFINKNNINTLIRGYDVAVNALDFSSDIPFLFDACCREYHMPVLHPYNIGWGGLVIVVEPDGVQLSDFSNDPSNFEVRLVQHIAAHFRLLGQPKHWIERVLAQYETEKQSSVPPQLSVASWIAGGLCTSLLFCLATGKHVKRYPKFYLSSIIDDER